MFNENGTTALFGWFHIIYILVSIPVFVFSLLLVYKKVKNEKTLDIIIYSVAAFLFLFVIAQRCSVVYWEMKNGATRDVFGETRTYSWAMILPDSICGLASLSILPAILIKKKNNYYLEGIYAIAMLGTLSNIFYPNYIEYEPLWQLRSWGGLAHHFIAGWLLTLMLMKKYFTPTLKRWYVCPIILVTILLYGLFCLFVLKFAECMNISKPLVKGLVVSYYWGLCIGYLVINYAFLVSYHFIKKKLESKKKDAN